MSAVDYDQKGVYDDPFVFCSNGTKFYLRRPTFDVGVIAHSLCNNIRFNGHIKFPYSVGQHSMLVADIVDMMLCPEPYGEAQLEALLHDATEAYLSDIPAPFKRDLPDWRGVDKVLDAELRSWFGLPYEKSEVVATADWYALFIEATALLPTGCAEQFEDPLGLREKAIHFANFYELWEDIVPMDLERDRKEFLNYYKTLA